MLPLLETLRKTQKLCVKCMQTYEFLSFPLLKNKSHWASFGWRRHTALTNATFCDPAQEQTLSEVKNNIPCCVPALSSPYLQWCCLSCTAGCWHRTSRRCDLPLPTARNSIALTYRHFFYPSEGPVVGRSIDRFLEPRLHIAICTLGWVFLWIHSDSQVAWELYRARELG